MSDGDYSPLKAALEKLTIPDVWQRLGVEGIPGRNGKTSRSPFRQDKHPSFVIYADAFRWHDHATGDGGDAADFCAKARGLSREDGARLLIDLAGTRKRKDVTHSGPDKREQYDPFKDEEKTRKREGWPFFQVPTQAEIAAIATLRGLSPEGIALAHERDLLFCADTIEGRGWVITDSRRKNAQARRMDGEDWERFGAKAWTLPGSIGALPIGLYEARDFPNIALVEGGPDFLAVFHLAWCATSTPETVALGKGIDVLGKLGVVAMLGVPSIPEEELIHFRGKHVRIFADADMAGQDAKRRWRRQLRGGGAKVDSYSFAGLVRFDGKPVKDLNDFVLICSDQLEAERQAVEEAFRF